MRAVFLFSPTIFGFMGSFDIQNGMHIGTMNQVWTAPLIINNLRTRFMERSAVPLKVGMTPAPKSSPRGEDFHLAGVLTREDLSLNPAGRFANDAATTSPSPGRRAGVRCASHHFRFRGRVRHPGEPIRTARSNAQAVKRPLHGVRKVSGDFSGDSIGGQVIQIVVVVVNRHGC